MVELYQLSSLESLDQLGPGGQGQFDSRDHLPLFQSFLGKQRLKETIHRYYTVFIIPIMGFKL